MPEALAGRASALKTDPDALSDYGRDESDLGTMPAVWWFPAPTAEVSACPHRPRAPRPGHAVWGQAERAAGRCRQGVVLSVERMNAIRSISTEDLVACRARRRHRDLMKAVEAKGLFLRTRTPWEWCTLGGNVAENAGGPQALVQVTRDYVLGMSGWPEEVLVSAGAPSRGGGYDLVGLLVGEGTWASPPGSPCSCFRSPERSDGAAGLRRRPGCRQGGERDPGGGRAPRTLELMDDLAVKAVDGKGFNFRPAPAPASWPRWTATCPRRSSASSPGWGIAEQPEPGDLARSGRGATGKALGGAADGEHRAAQPGQAQALEDIVVPARIPEMIDRCKAAGQGLGLTVATYGHAGDGNLHANILFDSLDERPKVDDALRQMAVVAIELGGTITGEHGIGIAKRDLLPLEQSAGVLALQRKLKQVFDPDGFLNPGKFLPD